MKRIELERIRYDGGTQVRENINLEVVEEYSEHIAQLPPITVFFDGKFYWLADGFHRYYAHKTAGEATIAVDIRNGTLQDAIVFAVGSNRTHGLQRTNADKHKAVKMLLADPRYAHESNVKIAAVSGVSEGMVRIILENSYDTNLQLSCSTPQEPKKTSASTPPKTAPIEILPMKMPPEPIKKVAASVPFEDATGRVIEDSKIAADFARIGEIDQILRQLSNLKTLVLKAHENKDRLYQFVNPSAFHADITNIYNSLKLSRPYAVCPYCGGRTETCNVCQQSGWVGKSAYDFAPKNLKELA